MQNTKPASLCQTVLVRLQKDGTLCEVARTASRTVGLSLARKLAPVLGDIVVLSVDGRVYTVRG